MKTVKMVRFLGAGNELWGRRVTVLRAEDGYGMRLEPGTGLVFIMDPKEGVEVVVHASRCDVYLASEAPPPSKSEVKK